MNDLIYDEIRHIISTIEIRAMEAVREQVRELARTAVAAALGVSRPAAVAESPESRDQESSSDPRAVAVLQYLLENPGSKISEVMDGTGLSRVVARSALQKLRDSGEVLKAGDKGQTVYYLS